MDLKIVYCADRQSSLGLKLLVRDLAKHLWHVRTFTTSLAHKFLQATDSFLELIPNAMP